MKTVWSRRLLWQTEPALWTRVIFDRWNKHRRTSKPPLCGPSSDTQHPGAPSPQHPSSSPPPRQPVAKHLPPPWISLSPSPSPSMRLAPTNVLLATSSPIRSGTCGNPSPAKCRGDMIVQHMARSAILISARIIKERNNKLRWYRMDKFVIRYIEKRLPNPHDSCI